MAGCCITDDEAVCRASEQEIIRRYYIRCSLRQGMSEREEVYKLELCEPVGNFIKDRPVVDAALKRQRLPVVLCSPSMNDGRIITGRHRILGASALLDALKELGGIQHEIALYLYYY